MTEDNSRPDVCSFYIKGYIAYLVVVNTTYTHKQLYKIGE